MGAQQYRRMMRLVASASVLLCQRRQVQLFDHIDDKARQVLIRQPLINRRWQQVVGLAVYWNKAAHDDIPVVAR
jgi:hypothetical protein